MTVKRVAGRVHISAHQNMVFQMLPQVGDSVVCCLSAVSVGLAGHDQSRAELGALLVSGQAGLCWYVGFAVICTGAGFPMAPG